MSDVKASQGAWERWKDLAARAATFQARVLLVLFYWLFVAPFALLVRAFSDPLDLDPARGGRWRRPPESEPPRQH